MLFMIIAGCILSVSVCSTHFHICGAIAAKTTCKPMGNQIWPQHYQYFADLIFRVYRMSQIWVTCPTCPLFIEDPELFAALWLLGGVTMGGPESYSNRPLLHCALQTKFLVPGGLRGTAGSPRHNLRVVLVLHLWCQDQGHLSLHLICSL